MLFVLFTCYLYNPIQSKYSLISNQDIQFEHIDLSDAKAIKELVENDVECKAYIPPTGDSEAYDSILYCRSKDIKLSLHHRNKEPLISTITFTSSKYKLRILNKSYKVGQSVTVLSIFEKSYAEFSQRLQTHDPQKEICLHNTILDSIKNEEGILAFTVKNDLIVEISLSFDPA